MSNLPKSKRCDLIDKLNDASQYIDDIISIDNPAFAEGQKRSTEGCSKFKGPETRQVQERLVSTLEHMQVPKWDRTRCPEE